VRPERRRPGPRGFCGAVVSCGGWVPRIGTVAPEKTVPPQNPDRTGVRFWVHSAFWGSHPSMIDAQCAQESLCAQNGEGGRGEATFSRRR
jgi:hypothetical protein